MCHTVNQVTFPPLDNFVHANLIIHVKDEKYDKYPVTVTAGFLGKITGSTGRCSLDLVGFGGVICPLRLRCISVCSKLW